MKRQAKTRTLASAFVISLAIAELASLPAQTTNANPVLPDAPSRPLVSVASVQHSGPPNCSGPIRPGGGE